MSREWRRRGCRKMERNSVRTAVDEERVIEDIEEVPATMEKAP
jgi:hypothetical protein